MRTKDLIKLLNRNKRLYNQLNNQDTYFLINNPVNPRADRVNFELFIKV